MTTKRMLTVLRQRYEALVQQTARRVLRDLKKRPFPDTDIRSGHWDEDDTGYERCEPHVNRLLRGDWRKPPPPAREVILLAVRFCTDASSGESCDRLANRLRRHADVLERVAEEDQPWEDVLYDLAKGLFICDVMLAVEAQAEPPLDQSSWWGV